MQIQQVRIRHSTFYPETLFSKPLSPIAFSSFVKGRCPKSMICDMLKMELGGGQGKC